MTFPKPSAALMEAIQQQMQRADAGDVRARDALFAQLYDELHRLARREVRRFGSASPLGATTLLHEAYLAFGQRDRLAFPDEARFLAYAVKAMRGVVIDRVRAEQAVKRGSGARVTTLDAEHAGDVTDAEELLAVHDALERLERIDPSLAQTVDMRFFCGFTFEEIARVHGVTERTAQRRWEKARLYLRAALSNAPGADAETRE